MLKSHAKFSVVILAAVLVLLSGFVKPGPFDKPKLTGTVIVASSPTPDYHVTRKPVITATPPAYP